MEPLVEISRSEWPRLREVFRTDWPYGAEAYCLLDTQISHPELNEAFKLKVYCPQGKFTNGVIAISDKNYYQVFVCPVTEDMTVIETALRTTKIIDWNRTVSVPSANPVVLACIKRIGEHLNLKTTYENRVLKHIRSRDTNPIEIVNCPEKTYIGPLKPEHIDLIDRTWTFHNPCSREFFETLMNNGLTYVLYSSEDQQPLCWISVDDMGAFSHLYCLAPHRRKGYAEYVTKFATNDLLTKGKDVLAYTLEDNVRAQNLFQKLGFNFVGYVWWIFLTK